ncbi:MAG: hypothetical protein AAGU76_08670 [Sedimentibacter sp.]|uniref:hypothetical protein n=1 Tax=Sedimentibacter sp. TaxID=1960295 RepID=UPI0031586D0B
MRVLEELSCTIYVDETFYKKRKPDQIKIEDGKYYRSLSRNQECIFTAIDASGNIVALINGTGKPSQKYYWEILGNRIRSESHIIHDKERSHRILVYKLNLTEDVYDSKEVKKLSSRLFKIFRIHKKWCQIATKSCL